MKTQSALAFALLALLLIAAAPAPTETAPELSLPDLASTYPAEIGTPDPLFRANPCFDQCLAIRAQCDANCTTTQCHRECRDSAIQCLSQC